MQHAATDDVTDLIASIEMHRQEIERDGGLEASRSYALGRLHEALACEPSPANVEALTQAVKRVQTLGSRTVQRPTLKVSRLAQPRFARTRGRARSQRRM